MLTNWIRSTVVTIKYIIQEVLYYLLVDKQAKQKAKQILMTSTSIYNRHQDRKGLSLGLGVLLARAYQLSVSDTEFL